MKTFYESFLRWLLRRRESENVFMPVARYFVFYILLIAFLLGLMSLALPVLPLEMAYTLAVAFVIIFGIMFSFYWVTGKLHGRLGFNRSVSIGVLITIVAGASWFAGVLCLHRITGGQPLPWVYSVVSTLVVTASLFVGARYFGGEMVDWIEEVGRYAPQSSEVS